MRTDKLTDFLHRVEESTKKPEKYLSVQEDQSESIKHLTRDLYNFTKQTENSQLKQGDTLEELVISNLDDEQIWQQIELQNNSICNNLVGSVARLLACKTKLKFFPEKKKKRVEFEESKEEESEDGEEGEEDEEEDVVERKNDGGKVNRAKGKSIVDDKFFKLHEMENFLEKMEKGDGGKEDDDDEEEEIDYFQGGSENDDEGGDEMRYDDFFDEPEDAGAREADFDAEGEEEEEVEDEGGHTEEEEGGYTDEEEQNEEEEHTEEDSDDSSIKNKSQPSSFEARQERLKERVKKLEEEALKEKPWQMKGEITGSNRPQNSLLEEYVEFDTATRPPPVLTEKSTMKLEDVIIQRIKDKAWDDVVRKFKPDETSLEYKKKLVLDQEKSKLSLAQIYENEYLKQLESKSEVPGEKPEVEPTEHQEIRIMMKKLFSKLDALSNFHFTPKQVEPEVKIVSNVPAINMEEVAPVATSDATLLAPEEVKAKRKGDLIGKTERTKTDKKRERRQKKLKQKIKYKQLEAKEKLGQGKDTTGDKSKTKTNKISKSFLQKITKSRNVTQMELKDGGKSVKSSNAFFTKLQDETRSLIKKKIGNDNEKSVKKKKVR